MCIWNLYRKLCSVLWRKLMCRLKSLYGNYWTGGLLQRWEAAADHLGPVPCWGSTIADSHGGSEDWFKFTCILTRRSSSSGFICPRKCWASEEGADVLLPLELLSNGGAQEVEEPDRGHRAVPEGWRSNHLRWARGCSCCTMTTGVVRMVWRLASSSASQTAICLSGGLLSSCRWRQTRSAGEVRSRAEVHKQQGYLQNL